MTTQDNSSVRKLRSACDPCHSAKVRCSGERTGCNRCSHGGRICRYSISNMGRTLGERKPRRKQLHRPLQSQQQNSWHTVVPIAPQLPTNSGHWTPPPPFTPNSDKNWSQFSEECNLNAIFPDFSSETISLSPLSATDETSTQPILHVDTAPDLNLLTPETSSPLDLDLYIPNHDLSETPSPSTSTNSPGGHLNSCPTGTAEFHDTTAIWTYQISGLSQKLSRSPLLPIDEVLTTNSTLVNVISSTLHHLPPDLSSQTSVLLFMPICMTQILGLFEQSVVCPNEDNPDTPRLQLGSYQIDIESQRRLQGPIVRRELMNLFDAANRVKCLVSQQIKEGQKPYGQLSACEILVDDVLCRIRALGDKLKGN
ncbi:hypothetical protein B0J11DRAFT_135719 [Dendryphion nanum]|uniref:Zn(2)-C6 fungal-type domain-containing protein n=1 Tax=Dendryphion nanum TaxID=256645 RepID=A0A9P9D878_9PLEO|nr:hypothetical protein B0J11DRAFT_135719 [Dendryphion nanum]